MAPFLVIFDDPLGGLKRRQYNPMYAQKGNFSRIYLGGHPKAIGLLSGKKRLKE
jgi:hypothetical protein